jgi:hypothetical protein
MTHIDKILGAAIATLLLALATSASAQTDRAAGEPAQAYSLPWQLRPATIGNVVRVESATAAFNDANGNFDLELGTMVSFSYQVTEEWAPMLRLGIVANDAPGAALDGGSFVNPVAGITYARELGSYRLALFGATTLPVGSGTGNPARSSAAKANVASSTARPADDAMFAVDYLTEIAGADFAYVGDGFTAQLEATLQLFFRVRGDRDAAALDAFRSNASLGLHLGYFLGSWFSLGADLRYQRWLTHPAALDRTSGARVPLPSAQMDAVTAALGPRFHFRVGQSGSMHPGLSLMRGFDARGFDAPLLHAETTAVQIDVPVQF